MILEKKQLKSLFTGIAVISALFSFAVSVLLVSDYYRVKRAEPLTSPVLVKLRERLHETPEDRQLREEIRELDFIARKAHFVSAAKMKKGVILLTAGLVLLLISLHILSILTKELAPPSTEKDKDTPLSSASKARFYISGAAVWILAVIFIITYLSPNKSSTPPPLRTADKHKLPDRGEFIRNWPEFRGNNGAAIVQTGKPPQKWNGKTGINIKWKTKLPLHGYSSPVIWKDKLFLTGGTKEERRVFCISRTDGKLIWQTTVPFMAPPGTKIPEVTEDTGFAAPTMTTDGTRVFAIFATGDITALSMDGKIIWQLNLGVPDNHYAYSSSLLFIDGKIIVQFDDSTRTEILALDPETGTVIWKNNRKASISWASPIAIQLTLPGEKTPQNMIITATSSTVSAHSASTGKAVWSIECMAGEVAPSPAYSDGMIFVANEFASAVALDAQSGKIIWQNEELDLPDVASPLATDGKVYLAASSGIVTCLNAKTGEEIWFHEYENGFYSSPILSGSLIYLLDMKGNMFIIRNSDKYEEVSKASLGEMCVTTPAFTGNTIYIRGEKHLYSISDL